MSNVPYQIKRRSPLILLTAVAVMIATTGCPNSEDPAASSAYDIGGHSEYVGAAICQRCHTEVHAQWSDSKHAQALATLRTVGNEGNPSCLPCHSTGFGQRGFVSAVLTPGLADVQCEACHGPGATHVGSRNPADLVRVPGSGVCGNCHTNPQQPEHDEWVMSKHATALETLRSDPQAQDECLTCHSYDYALAVRQNQSRAVRGLQPLALSSITDADKSNDPVESVACASCHQPHGSAFPAQLRSGATDTCVICHSDSQSSETPHSPQQNLLTASNGKKLGPPPDGVPVNMSGLPSVHSSLDEMGGCTKCHGTRVRQSSPTVESPNKTGHLFEVNFDNCTPCHMPAEASFLLGNLRSEIQPRIAAQRQRLDGIDRASLLIPRQAMLDAAALNMNIIVEDRSSGAHNAWYSRELLDASDKLIDAALRIP